MTLLSILTRSMAGTSLLAVSSLAQAGTSSKVIVGPVVTPVPTVSGYLLIVLGLLLAVIAFRTLRNNQGAQKLLGILVLGGGLVISGVGVDRTIALPDGTIIVRESDSPKSGCTSNEPYQYLSYSGSGDWSLNNGCSNPIEIKRFDPYQCRPPSFLDTENAGCKVGQVLAQDDECLPLPKCISGG